MIKLFKFVFFSSSLMCLSVSSVFSEVIENEQKDSIKPIYKVEKYLRPLMGKIRNQSTVGWCYANVASDLFSFHFLNPNKGDDNSAVFTALSYIDTYKKYFTEDGVAGSGLDVIAILNAKKNGYCPRQFDDALMSGGLHKWDLNAKFELIFKVYSLKKEILDLESKKAKNHSIDSVLDQKLERLNEEFENEVKEFKSSKSIIAPLLNRYTDEEISRFVKRTNESNFYYELSKKICTEKDRKFIKEDFKIRSFLFKKIDKRLIWIPQSGTFPIPFLMDVPAHSNLGIMSVYDTKDLKGEGLVGLWNSLSLSKTRIGTINILSAFDHYLSKNQPVSILYEANFLSMNFLEKNFIEKNYSQIRGGFHVSIIVGKRQNILTSETEYLIRNSWGTSCKSYHESLRSSHCEAGHLWVPANVIKAVGYGLTAIEPNESVH